MLRFAAALFIANFAAGCLLAVAEPPADRPRQLPDISSLIETLGVADFRQREAATRELISLGPAAAAPLRAALAQQRDPEILHRILFVLENLTPPNRAALVIRVEEDARLAPGDLITHANGRRIETQSELRQLLADAPGPVMVRALTAQGPVEVGPIRLRQLTAMADYQAPRGVVLAEALRLYAAGRAEQAYARLRDSGHVFSESELSPLLRARIAYTAGHGAEAMELLAGRTDAVHIERFGSPWTAPTPLDESGPGDAPYALEYHLFSEGGPATYDRGSDPDVRIQRVLVPAGRSVDALIETAKLWWNRYRERLVPGQENAAAGNLLAVIAWMFSDLELQSECCRLIRPRSAILNFTWIRVQTDSWLAFLAGDKQQAVTSFFDDARQVLARQVGVQDAARLVRNPVVAATIALFLYQTPPDGKATELLDLVNEPHHPAIAAYCEWMMFAVDDQNAERVREHLARLLPKMADDDAADVAFRLACMEYVRARPDDEVFAVTRQRVAQHDTPGRALRLAAIDAMAALRAGHLDEASAALELFGDEPGLAALRSTLSLRRNPPPGADAHPALTAPLLMTPAGDGERWWLVLTTEHALALFDAQAGQLTRLPPPTPNWYPGPLAFPWLSREPAAGRVWTYDRRRLVELTPEASPPVRMNIHFRDIPELARWLPVCFSALADAAQAPEPSAENGEFLRADVSANQAFTIDPDLPEISIIETLPADARVLHLGLRGGPQLLLDTTTGRVLNPALATGGQALGRWLPIAQIPATPESAPIVWLPGEGGLARVDLASGAVERVMLPGDAAQSALTPELTPYPRSDPRFVYVARLPSEGGQLFRIDVSAAPAVIEPLDTVNLALPRSYYRLQSRAAIRDDVDALLVAAGVPASAELIRDAQEVVRRWQEQDP